MNLIKCAILTLSSLFCFFSPASLYAIDPMGEVEAMVKYETKREVKALYEKSTDGVVTMNYWRDVVWLQPTTTERNIWQTAVAYSNDILEAFDVEKITYGVPVYDKDNYRMTMEVKYKILGIRD